MTQEKPKRQSWKSKEWKTKRAERIEGKVCEWCGSTTALAPHHKNKGDPNYMQLNDCMILCKRCHKAIHKGLLLCPVCKAHYMKPANKKCIFCAAVRFSYIRCRKEFEYDGGYPLNFDYFCDECEEESCEG